MLSLASGGPVLSMKSKASSLGEGPLLESVMGGGEGWGPGTVFGAFPSSINPESPWLRPKQQGGAVNRKKHKSRSNAFFEGEIINCNLIT